MAVFDLFGTLAESPSRPKYEDTLARMADAVGVARDEFRRLWFETLPDRETGRFASRQSNVQHICRRLGREASASALAEATRISESFSRNMLVFRPDAAPVLRRLKASGYKTGLISDTTWEIPAVWRASAMGGLTDVAIFSCEVGLKKPGPAIYELASERLGVRVEECLYVGDGGSGELTGATRAGMRAVQLRVPGEDWAGALRPGAEEWNGPVVGSLGEVPGLMDGGL